MTDPTEGSFDGYSVPDEAAKVFKNGILKNPLIASNLPQDFETYAKSISFHGSASPMIPINWRFAESISALKGLEALFVNALLVKKYNIEPQEIAIDTRGADRRVGQINNADGSTLTTASFQDKAGKELFDTYIHDADIYSKGSTGLYRTMATNIYKTKDNRYFHLHGSMNPEPSQDAVGVPHNKDCATFQESIAPYVEAVAQLTSSELQHRATDVFKQAGTICYSASEYAESAHGKANANAGLYEVHARPNPAQPPTWWTPTPSTSPSRPLAGLKVVA
ncbi:hypothetical protein LARI1_G001481 [Lachnellula arida]|uniref:Uncharacterized protein n=1 Tax=Lachnellula arida TaxID=1316785 RepID=A0A8T9BS51_9HELO|nr:hypothetical protein LARI1_G001481 [Lachnellula arida]